MIALLLEGRVVMITKDMLRGEMLPGQVNNLEESDWSKEMMM